MKTSLIRSAILNVTISPIRLALCFILLCDFLGLACKQYLPELVFQKHYEKHSPEPRVQSDISKRDTFGA